MNSADTIDADLHRRFGELIEARTGILFRRDRGESEALKLQNRLAKPLKRLKIPTYEKLLSALYESLPDSPVWIEFIHAVSTHKTEFFREPAHFDQLAGHAKALWRNNQTTVNVWSAACSTGEEAVSAAISLSSFPRTTSRVFQILATDIDAVVIEKAKTGIYYKPDLPQATLKLHFLEGRGDKAELVRVKDHIRDTIQFDQFNLIEPNYPARRHFDAIFCRNVLIYFDEQTRNNIVTRLAESLAPGGLLFLGHSESFSYRDDLECVAPTVYRNKASLRLTSKLLPRRGTR